MFADGILDDDLNKMTKNKMKQNVSVEYIEMNIFNMKTYFLARFAFV